MHSNGKRYVYKKASEPVIKKYHTLEKLGIGVPLKGHANGEIIMREITPLHKATKGQIPKDAIDQLERIHKILINNELAHCDIKVANIGIEGSKIVLIDADPLKSFGD